MSFRKLLLPFVAALCVFSLFFTGARASAQVGVYGTVTGERVTGITCLASDGVCAEKNGISHPYGSDFGAFYDFKKLGLISLGGDLRGSVTNDSKRADLYAASSGFTRYYTFMGGVRASLNKPVLQFIRPYGEVAGGWTRSNLQISVGSTNPATSYANFGRVEAFVGADVRILPFLDWRAVELGAGEMSFRSALASSSTCHTVAEPPFAARQSRLPFPYPDRYIASAQTAGHSIRRIGQNESRAHPADGCPSCARGGRLR